MDKSGYGIVPLIQTGNRHDPFQLGGGAFEYGSAELVGQKRGNALFFLELVPCALGALCVLWLTGPSDDHHLPRQCRCSSARAQIALPVAGFWQLVQGGEYREAQPLGFQHFGDGAN